MKITVLAGLLGSAFLMSGVFAFFFSAHFFGLLGEYYGAFNNHFVKDAGLAFFSSGLLLLLSVKMIEWRTPLILGGSIFVVLHGLFHIHMLIMGMVPTPLDAVIEIVIIISPSVLTLYLLLCQMKEHKSSNLRAPL